MRRILHPRHFIFSSFPNSFSLLSQGFHLFKIFTIFKILFKRKFIKNYGTVPPRTLYFWKIYMMKQTFIFRCYTISISLQNELVTK